MGRDEDDRPELFQASKMFNLPNDLDGVIKRWQLGKVSEETLGTDGVEEKAHRRGAHARDRLIDARVEVSRNLMRIAGDDVTDESGLSVF